MPVMDYRDPPTPEAVVTEIHERNGCQYVSGKVCRNGEWIDAAFTVPTGDISRMTREQFHAYAVRQLPHFCADVDWRSMVLA